MLSGVLVCRWLRSSVALAIVHSSSGWLRFSFAPDLTARSSVVQAPARPGCIRAWLSLLLVQSSAPAFGISGSRISGAPGTLRSSALSQPDAGLDAHCVYVFTCAHACLFIHSCACLFVCWRDSLLTFCQCIDTLTHSPTHSSAQSFVHVLSTSI